MVDTSFVIHCPMVAKSSHFFMMIVRPMVCQFPNIIGTCLMIHYSMVAESLQFVMMIVYPVVKFMVDTSSCFEPEWVSVMIFRQAACRCGCFKICLGFAILNKL